MKMKNEKKKNPLRISQISHLYERTAKVWSVELIIAQRSAREEKSDSNQHRCSWLSFPG